MNLYLISNQDFAHCEFIIVKIAKTGRISSERRP